MLRKMIFEINLFPEIIVSPILFFFLVFLLTKSKRETTNKTKLLPPGPRKLPIIGNLHQIPELSHRSLRNLSKKHGDLMFLQLGSAPRLVISSAEKAREIFKSHDLVFSGRPTSYTSDKIGYDYSGLSFAPYGEYWRQIRKLISVEMMTAKRIRSFGNIRVQGVASMIDQIASTCVRSTNNDNNNDPAVDLSSVAFLLTENVVSRVLFGKSVDEGRKRGEFQDMTQKLQHLAAQFNVADYFPKMGWINRLNGVDKRLDQATMDLDRFLDKIIDEHRDPMRPQPSDDDVEDLVDVLIRLQKDPCPTITITNTHIKGVIADLFAAATDPPSTAIVCTMAELIRNPSVKQKIEREVREVAKGKARVDETDLPKLVYLKHVIKETLRLHPPFPLIIRETTENCTIDNKYHVPAKTQVLVNVAAISTDSKHWKNPEEFWPERFANSQVDFKGLHFELLPFGVGRRGCPGVDFATPLLELGLANLLFRFDWKLPEGVLAEDLDMEAFGVAVSNKTPLCLMASPIMN